MAFIKKDIILIIMVVIIIENIITIIIIIMENVDILKKMEKMVKQKN